MRLTDKQWEKIEYLVPDGPVRGDGKGRPWRDKREVLEGILWIVKMGVRWRDLPKDYPPYQTCHRRFQQWVEDGTFDKVIEALVKDLQERGGIDMSECFINGTFSLAKKGGFLWERLWRGKGTKIMAITDAGGVVLSVRVDLQAITKSL
jgi:transposase